jgi:histidyl-tRNA synthetase
MVRVLSSAERFIETIGKENKNVDELIKLIEKLESVGIKNVVFDPTLMRGFDYYTAIVFEIFDTNTENNRSVFGGGRYDDLLDIFDKRKIPAIGFGAGDVTLEDFLRTHNLLPLYKPTVDLYITTLKTEYIENARILAETLRSQGLRVAINLGDKKVGDQVKVAHKQNIPYIIAIGENEIKSNMYTLKDMKTGVEITKDALGIVDEIKKSNSTTKQ